jgi:biopolymer transport protein ExbD
VRLRHEREPSPEINLTPLIDVVFLLLIFFMVSTTFERDAELLVELPQASSEAEPARQDTIEVVVDVQGRFYVGGHQLVNTQLDTVRRALEQAAEGLDEPQVVVSADAQTPHQAVVTVMDAARRAGLVRLTFAARLTEEAR